MEPMKRALLNAYATQKLQADEDLAREMLGDDFNDFREGTQEVPALVSIQPKLFRAALPCIP